MKKDFVAEKNFGACLRVLWCTEVCCMRRVGGEVRKGSEWWCEAVRLAVAEKGHAHKV